MTDDIFFGMRLRAAYLVRPRDGQSVGRDGSASDPLRIGATVRTGAGRQVRIVCAIGGPAAETEGAV